MVESGVTACCRLCPLVLRFSGAMEGGVLIGEDTDPDLEYAGLCRRALSIDSGSSPLASFLSRRNSCDSPSPSSLARWNASYSEPICDRYG
jgi:hypothetical protein